MLDLWGMEPLKNGHNLVTIGCKSLSHNASMGFDSPTSNSLYHNKLGGTPPLYHPITPNNVIPPRARLGYSCTSLPANMRGLLIVIELITLDDLVYFDTDQLSKEEMIRATGDTI